MTRYYLKRGQTRFRQISEEEEFSKALLNDFMIKELVLENITLLDQYKILNEAELVIFSQGSAGLSLINCSPSCIAIEISPRNIFLNEVEYQDAISRAGRHIVYVCDSQSDLMASSGDPVSMKIDYTRFAKLLKTLLD